MNAPNSKLPSLADHPARLCSSSGPSHQCFLATTSNNPNWGARDCCRRVGLGGHHGSEQARGMSDVEVGKLSLSPNHSTPCHTTLTTHCLQHHLHFCISTGTFQPPTSSNVLPIRIRMTHPPAKAHTCGACSAVWTEFERAGSLDSSDGGDRNVSQPKCPTPDHTTTPNLPVLLSSLPL